MTRLKLLIISLLIVLAVPTAHASKQPLGDIAFVRNGDIYTVTLDGKLVRQLTTDGRNAFPMWSPNGRYIAFSKASIPVGGQYKSAAIWIITSDGKYQKALTKFQRFQGHYPTAWLSNSRGIIYTDWALDSDVGSEFKVAYLSKARNPNAPVDQWTRTIKRAGLHSKPPHMPGGALAFSPSYSKVIFMGSARESDNGYPIYDLYMMNADGSGVRRVEKLEHKYIECLRWNPTSGILSAEKHYLGNLKSESGIWLRDSKGKTLKKIADLSQPSFYEMDWSPKGDRIIYQMSEPGYPAGNLDPLYSGFEHPENFAVMSQKSAVWILKADGSEKRRFASNACHPNWR